MAEQHKIGTRIVFSNGEELEDITNGREYTICGIDDVGDEYFIDDAGEEDFAACSAGDGIYEVVFIPTK